MSKNPLTTGLFKVLSIVGVALFMLSLLLENVYYRAVIIVGVVAWVALMVSER